MFSYFFIIALILHPTSQIISTGHCRQTQFPSIDQYENHFNWGVLLSVPFSSHGSNIFKSIPTQILKPTMFRLYLAINYPYGPQIKLKFVTVPHWECFGTIKNSTAAAKSNAIFEANTTVQILQGEDAYEKVKCHPELTERIQIWYDSGFAFLWSCFQDDGSEQYDEAILVATDPYNISITDNGGQRLRATLHTLRNILGKYVSKETFASIDWHPKNYDEEQNPFKCINEYSALIPWRIIGIVILVIFCFGFVIFCNDVGQLNITRNRVAPLHE